MNKDKTGEEVDNTTVPTPQNEDEKNNKPQADEDKDKEVDVDVEKQEVVEDPYEKKLAELESKNKNLEDDARRKTAALKEAKEKLKDMKDNNPEATVLNEEVVRAEIEKIASGKLSSIEEIAKKAIESAQQIAIDAKVSKIASNEGEEKIIKHFLKNKVNPNLPLDEQIQQAKILTDAALISDTRFQQEVEKANKQTVKTTGKVDDKGSVWSDDDRAFANAILQTDKGRKAFEEIGKSN